LGDYELYDLLALRPLRIFRKPFDLVKLGGTLWQLVRDSGCAVLSGLATFEEEP
jgi:hypothetical protein